MNDADFAALVESIKQAGRIRRGLEPPSQVYTVDAPGHIVLSDHQWDLILDHIEDLEDAVAVYKMKWKLATESDDLIELSPEDIRQWLSKDANNRAGIPD